MKLKLGPIVAQASGSIAGTVFSRNRGGNYARTRAIPTNPNTNAQQNVRGIFSTVSQAWAALTAAQRAAWENWANQNLVTDVLGDQIQLSGHQAHQKLNQRLSFIGSTVITEPPISAAPAGLTSITQTGDLGLGDFDLVFAASPTETDDKLWMRAALINSAGITYHTNALRFTGVSAAADTTPFDNLSQVTAKFGTPIVGQTLHMHVSVIDTLTGLRSGELSSDVVITETS